jgi:hypothetical protein
MSDFKEEIVGVGPVAKVLLLLEGLLYPCFEAASFPVQAGQFNHRCFFRDAIRTMFVQKGAR